jgi:Zn-dependent metalloprotease
MASHSGCVCSIIPIDVLRDLSRDPTLDPAEREKLQKSAAVTADLATIREVVRAQLYAAKFDAAPLVFAGESAAAPPLVQVFDCQHRRSLPGRLISDSHRDEAAATVLDTTKKMADFCRDALGRNSVDDDGLDLTSSVRYGTAYQNAFWNGMQMVYGEGDGQIFVDFWRSADVIGHELTHGITQYESGLIYEGEPGALNESLSDCVGAAFAQWIKGQDVTDDAGWLIGAGIMGPRATGAGRTCLRDMKDPGAAHCLSPQPAHYRDVIIGGDVHENSGIPNKAFYNFAAALGGQASGKALKVWYGAADGGKLPSNASFRIFRDSTVAEAAKEGVEAECVQAWGDVGL